MQISVPRPDLLKEVFGDFPQSLQANARIIPRIDHDCLLSNPFQIIIISSVALYLDTESVVKQPTTK
jgi:hypothetical protein